MSEAVNFVAPITIIGTSRLTSTSVPFPAVGDTPDPSPWNNFTTYGLEARVRDNITLKIYESQQAGNLNHNPTTDTGTWWLEVGYVNYLRMFDSKNTSQTSKADDITVEVTPGVSASQVSLLNVSGSDKVIITQTDPIAGLVFPPTEFPMRSPPSAAGLYEYLFDPIELKTELFVEVPLYPLSTIKVEVLTNTPGNVIAVGSLVIGPESTLFGTARRGMRLGVDDYSSKTRNAWGDLELLEGAYSANGSTLLYVPANQVDSVINRLIAIRAKVVLFNLSAKFSKSRILGFLKAWSMVAEYDDYSVLSLDIEGIT